LPLKGKLAAVISEGVDRYRAVRPRLDNLVEVTDAAMAGGNGQGTPSEWHRLTACSAA
jgi:hypothetical protein